jgi:hypothetical protein
MRPTVLCRLGAIYCFGKIAAMKTCSTIWSVLGIALGFAVPNTQARAQAPACVVVEVMAEWQEASTQKLLPAVDKRGKEKAPKHLAQQATTDPLIGSPPALGFGDRQHGSTEKDEAGAHSSIREKAFASGQSLADYCNFKVDTERKR